MSENEVECVGGTSRTDIGDYVSEKIYERILKVKKIYNNQKCLLIVFEIFFIISFVILGIPITASGMFADIHPDDTAPFVKVNIYSYDTGSVISAEHTGNLPVPPRQNLPEEIFNGIPFYRSISVGSKSIINDAVRLEKDNVVVYNFDPEKNSHISNIYFMINAINAYNVIANPPKTTQGTVFGKVKIYVEDYPIPYEQELIVGENIRSWWKGKIIENGKFNSFYSTIFYFGVPSLFERFEFENRDLTQVFSITSSSQTKQAWISDSGDHAADILTVTLPQEYQKRPITSILIYSETEEIIPDGSTTKVFSGLRLMGITLKRNPIVVVDPGHIPTEKPVEYAIGKGVGDILKNKLEEKGMVVYQTTSTDYPTARATYANDLKPDIFVSLHSNAFAGSSKGSEVWIYDDEDSPLQKLNEFDLAVRTVNNLKHEIGSYLRSNCGEGLPLGVKEKCSPWTIEEGIPILKKVTASPAVLLEMEFYDYGRQVLYKGVTYPNMRFLMNSIIWQEDAAQGIANGIYGYFAERGMTITAHSPVEILVKDTDGLIISKQFGEIQGATYNEIDLDGDGDIEEQIRIPDRKIGDYFITVLPKLNANPTDTYILEISQFETPIILAENVQIKDIPKEPYLIKSTSTGIVPQNIPPVAIPNGPYISEEGVPIFFDGSNSYGTIVTYNWDFGDGNIGTGVYPIHTFAQNGTYIVTLTVTDNNGAIDTKNTTATIEETVPDLNPPSTNVLLNPPVPNGDNNWYISNIQVSINATDFQLGVNRTEYSFDNITWHNYTSPFNVYTEGTTTIFARSYDYAGNIEIPVKTEFKLDKTNPVTTAALNGSILNGAFTKNATLTLTAKDNLSGIASTNYSIDGIIWNKYLESITIAKIGLSKINYRSEDNASNMEEIKSIDVIISNPPPKLNIIPDIIVNETEVVRITPTASDPESDPLTFTFSPPLNSSGMWQTTYEDAGEYTARVTVSDGFSNVSQDVKITVLNVNRPPVLSPIGKLNATAGSYFSYNVIASDPDNDQLTYSDNSPMFDINPFTGEIGFVPRGNQSFNITVSDGTESVSEKGSLEVRSTNSPPEMEFIFPKTALAGSNFTLMVNASDPDGDNLTYADDTELFDINATTGRIEFTPGSGQIGTYFINITVTDGIETDEAVLNLVVRPDRPLRLEPVQDIVAYVGDLVKIIAKATYE